jgi:hypothetical protein
MIYLRARWYDGYLNRFLSPDLIIPDFTKPQNLNRYVYCLNDPVNCVDPSGLQGGPAFEFGTGGGEDLPPGQYYYTAYGWIDRSHVGTGQPGEVIQQVRTRAEQGGGYVTIKAPISVKVFAVWFQGTYWVEGSVSEEQVVPVALGMFYDWSSRFEMWQGEVGEFWTLRPLLGSRFAIEDLPSNFLGFYSAVTGKSKTIIVLDDLGGCVDAPATEPPDSWGPWGDRKNFEFLPKVQDEKGAWVHVPWPDDIQQLLDSMATEESGLWRFVSTQEALQLGPFGRGNRRLGPWMLPAGAP